jgi:hypothetical protein
MEELALSLLNCNACATLGGNVMVTAFIVLMAFVVGAAFALI